MTKPFDDLSTGENSGFAALATPDGVGVADLPRLLEQEAQAVIPALHKHGAILFRGFEGLSARNLEESIAVVTPDLHDYIGGGSPRTRVSGHVFNSTEYAAEAHLRLHIEASYLKTPPLAAWFYCDVEPTSDGETPLGDMRSVLDRLDPGLVQRFARDGICYVNNLHSGDGFGKSWQDTFQTSDRGQVADLVQQKDMDHHWHGDTLQVLMRAPALREHKTTGTPYWYNQVATWHHASHPSRIAASLERIYRDPWHYPKSAFFGNGSPISDEDVRQLTGVLDDAETTFRWRKGDLLLVDNQAVAHGRRPVTSARRILVVLA